MFCPRRLVLQVVLAADRLCYAASPDASAEARYIPLDRVPVRAIPRGYHPDVGASLVEDRHADLGPALAGCMFSLACGSHVHLFAASSPEEAQVRGRRGGDPGGGGMVTKVEDSVSQGHEL